MKQIVFSILLLLANAISYAQKPVVVATTTMIADMARQVAGDALEINCIMPIGGDPHTYEPTPQDAQLLARANMVLKNGLHLEGWLDKLIDNSGSANAKVISVSDGILALSSAVHNTPDPHAWMTAANGRIYVANITKAFCELLPSQSELFQKNATRYDTQLKELDDYMRQRILAIPAEKRILVTSHDAFHYYGNAYGLRVEATMGTSTDADVRTEDVAALSKIIDESHIAAIFVESTINPKLLQQLARDKGIRIGGSLFADSLGDENSGGSTYLDMLRHNTDIIADGLLGTPETEQTNKGTPSWLLFSIIGAVMLLGLVWFYIKMDTFK